MIAERTTADSALPRMTVEQYHMLAERGLIADGTPLELLGGVLVLKDRRDSEGTIMTVGRRHAAAVRRLEKLLSAALETANVCLQTQLPVTIDEESDPEPDVAVLTGTIENYDVREPHAGDARLLIEVADSSLTTDRGIKRVRYAAAGVPYYWVVNLRNDTVEVFTPESTDAAIYDSSTLTTIPVADFGVEIDLKAIFPAD